MCRQLVDVSLLVNDSKYLLEDKYPSEHNIVMRTYLKGFLQKAFKAGHIIAHGYDPVKTDVIMLCLDDIIKAAAPTDTQLLSVIRRDFPTKWGCPLDTLLFKRECAICGEIFTICDGQVAGAVLMTIRDHFQTVTLPNLN